MISDGYDGYLWNFTKGRHSFIMCQRNETR